MGTPNGIFISYAKEDVETAKKIYEDLKENGLSPWLDSENLLPGSDWRVEISQAIENCSYFLAIFSSNSVNKKGYVQKELKEALDILDQLPEAHIYIIPSRINECTPSYKRLKDLHWVDLFPSYEKGLAKILEVVSPTSAPSHVIRSSENLQSFDFEMQKRGLYNQTITTWAKSNRIKITNDEIAKLLNVLLIPSIESLIEKWKLIQSSELAPLTTSEFENAKNELTKNNIETAINIAENAFKNEKLNVPLVIFYANILCFNREIDKALNVYWWLINQFDLPQKLLPDILLSKRQKLSKNTRYFSIDIPSNQRLLQIVCTPNGLATKWNNRIEVYSWAGESLFIENQNIDNLNLVALTKAYLLAKNKVFSIFSLRNNDAIIKKRLSSEEQFILFQFPSDTVQNVSWNASYTSRPTVSDGWFEKTFLTNNPKINRTEFIYHYKHLNIEIRQEYRFDAYWSSNTKTTSYERYVGQGIFVPGSKSKTETVRKINEERLLQITPMS